MRIFKIFPLLFFILFFTTIAYFLVRYFLWQRSSFVDNQSFVCFTDFNEEADIDEKIQKFVISDSRTEFVVFSDKEVLNILKTNIQPGKYFVLKDVCTISGRGVWIIYLKYEKDNLKLPWIRMDVVKDNRETAELYVRYIYIGDIKIGKLLSKDILVNLNKGISDAIILLNENSFLGREIKNVELLEDRVVVKGSK